MMFRSLSFALLLVGTAASAEPVDKYGITAEEHAACDNDAVTYCASTYPDQELLLACMKSNLRKLSRPCSAAFVSGLKRRHMAL